MNNPGYTYRLCRQLSYTVGGASKGMQPCNMTSKTSFAKIGSKIR